MLARVPEHFVLYGGTAVALRLGHRVSVDFDFFSARSFTPAGLIEQMPLLGTEGSSIQQSKENTFELEVPGPEGRVKLAFFGGIGFGQINPPDRCPDTGLKVASAEDLLALKLGTINVRVEAKDYLDIGALLQAGLSLPVALGHLEALHPQTTNWMITLRTLVYFQGGDLGKLPEKLKRDLEVAVQRVREVPEFAGEKKPIGWMG